MNSTAKQVRGLWESLCRISWKASGLCLETLHTETSLDKHCELRISARWLDLKMLCGLDYGFHQRGPVAIARWVGWVGRVRLCASAVVQPVNAPQDIQLPPRIVEFKSKAGF
jgi:hypothetical protein